MKKSKLGKFKKNLINDSIQKKIYEFDSNLNYYIKSNIENWQSNDFDEIKEYFHYDEWTSPVFVDTKYVTLRVGGEYQNVIDELNIHIDAIFVSLYI